MVLVASHKKVRFGLAAPSAVGTSPSALASHATGIRRGMLRTNFNSVRFVVDVENALLNLFVDFLGCVDESLFNIGCGFCGGFHEDKAVFSGKCLTFLFFHLTSTLQVALVANQHDDHVRAGMLP